MGNGKANGQAKRTIRSIKDVIRKLLLKYPDSHWSDHVAVALMALRFAPAQAVGLPPFTILTGRSAILPSQLITWGEKKEVPAEPTAEELDYYVDLVIEGVEPISEVAQKHR